MDHSNEQHFWFGGDKPFRDDDKHFSPAGKSAQPFSQDTAESLSKVFRADEGLLRDHLIYGEPVLVGAAYLSLFIDLILRNNQRQDLRITRLSYANALAIGTGQTKIVAARIRHEGDRYTLEAVVPGDNAVPEQLYAGAQVKGELGIGAAATDALNLKELLATAIKREFPEEAFYKHPDQRTYGPSLMSVFSVYRLANTPLENRVQVLGEIRLTAEMKQHLKDFYIHPALFDACHVVSSFVLGDDVVAQHRVPLMMKEIDIHYVDGLNLEYAFCHVELLHSNDQISEMNFKLADSTGLVIASIKGFVTKTVPSREAMLGNASTAAAHEVRPVAPVAPASQESVQQPQLPVVDATTLEKRIKEYLRQKLAVIMATDAGSVAIAQNFMDMGIESNSIVGVVQNIETEVEVELYPTLLFEHQNINALASYLNQEHATAFARFFSVDTTLTPVSHEPPVPVTITTAKAPAVSREVNVVQDQVPLTGNLKKSIQGYLKEKVALLLAIPADQVPVAKNFMDLGIDSNNMIGTVRDIENERGIELYPTLLFERQNIEQLAEYFHEEHQPAFAALLSATPVTVVATPTPVASAETLPVTNASTSNASVTDTKARNASVTDTKARADEPTHTYIAAPTPVYAQPEANDQDIAIVGMSGYLPQSGNLHEFWDHLVNSRDLITEVPKDHWDIDAWYDENRQAHNKTYSRWGGFLKNIDQFDANFFGISPRQAEWIDPQLRLLLQSVQHTLEDACQINSVFGSKTGVYVGCCFQEYWDEIVRARIPLTDYQADSSVMSTLSATISYMFDLQGASVPLDNACASSLTALHLACQSLRTGENDQAIVGGVNALLSPLHYVYFSRMQALSPTGRCYSFDKKANGYVPGEGTVSILIKPLSAALANGDNIHAIIKASGINHVGRSNNAVSPRPELQTRLLRDTWDRFGINPADLTYMETHGTGTVLGDPIEVNALKAAFKPYTKATGFCTLGSTKAHTGHLEGAAGLTSVIKVMLMMKHRKIPKMPNFEELNPYIKLSDSPFEINRELLDWQVGAGKKRLAGVSSFGMTGNNSHVVLEEYVAPDAHLPANASDRSTPQFIPLSAKNPERLTAGVKTLLEFIQGLTTKPALEDLAYSLQVGRQSMAERLVLCVASYEELLAQLNGYLQGTAGGTEYFRGRAPAEVELADHFASEADFLEHLRALYRSGDLPAIAHLWLKGLEPAWALLRQTEQRRKISLPGYAFATDRYWVPEEHKYLAEPVQEKVLASTWNSSQLKQALHPLVHENCSGFETTQYRTLLSGTEFFVDQHRVNGEPVLPGVAYLEMAGIAAGLASGRQVLGLRNIAWIKPVMIAEQEKDLAINLVRQDSEVKYKISSSEDGLHSQGVVILGDLYPHAQSLDIAAINQRCSGAASAADIYHEFAAQGIEYGDAFKSLTSLRFNTHEVCARFALQAGRPIALSAFTLDPSIMDAALQSTIGLKLANAGVSAEKKLELPFAINAVTIFASLPAQGYLHVRYTSGSGFHDRVSNHDIDICDEQGNVCVAIQGFSTRTILVGDSDSSKNLVAPAARNNSTVRAATANHQASAVVSIPVVESGLPAVEAYLQNHVADILKLRVADVPLDEEMSAYGLDSITLTELSNRIAEDLAIQLAPTVFFEYATLQHFAAYLQEDYATNIDKFLATDRGHPAPLEIQPTTAIAAEDGTSLESWLTETVGQILKLSPSEITLDEAMSSFGLDSITLTELSNQVTDNFSIQLTPTIFFEYTTLGEFAQYLQQEHTAAISRVLANATPVATIGHTIAPTITVPLQQSLQEVPGDVDDIAIVGISGCFPMASDASEFWQNIVQGKDCISEIPGDRWNWREIFGDPHTEDNKSNVKWGGFIRDLDKFDPLFFGISPHEAELMDPQQRLLMEHTWAAIEDAGHSAKDLWGTATAIFVGTANTGYQQRVLESDIPIEGHSSTAVVPSAGPNRLSYYLNLRGPSEPIETACSSALVAIHRGMLSIQSGECDQVLAGGINTLLAPEVHLSFNKAGMLCEDGRCKTFSRNANGYVRGEGAGMVLLKRLSQAKQDRNSIYAVIKSSAENHGGRAQSLTAPNANAQAELLVTAYKKAQIDPRTVTYIEAHGTGTPLGDPVEINALKKAFTALYEHYGVANTDNTVHCGLGSVKSNIGHLELAAGVAGLTKVLFAMKHGILPPSIHCEDTNPYIDLAQSPFYIVKQAQPWRRQTDASGREIPRRAGVSSFGFGGVNAHLVLEEYIDPERSLHAENNQREQLYPLSAKSEQSLKGNAQRLRDFLADNDPASQDLAFTLQTGRVAMEYRLAIIAASKVDLLSILDAYLAGNSHAQLYVGTTENKGSALIVDGQGSWVSLAQTWLKGGYLQWSADYLQQVDPRRIPLPTYAFAKERYWLEEKPFDYGRKGKSAGIALGGESLQLQNASTLFEQKYQSLFSGDEWYFADHRVLGQKILPGVAYIELARAAAEQASQQKVIRIDDIAWVSPLIAEPGISSTLNTRLQPEAADISQLEFEIVGDDEILYSQGRVQLGDAYAIGESRDLAAIKHRCTGFYAKDIIYKSFSALGLEYGAAFRALEEIHSNGREVFARIKLPDVVTDSPAGVLAPSLLDAALQSVIGFALHQAAQRDAGTADSSTTVDQAPYVPFALQSLHIYAAVERELFVYATEISSSRESGVVQYDIELLNSAGEACIKLEAFSARRLTQNPLPRQDNAHLLFGHFGWSDAALPAINTAQALPQHCTIVIAQAEAAQRFSEANPALDIHALDVAMDISESSLRHTFLAVFNRVKELLATRGREPGYFLLLVPETLATFRYAAVAGLLKTAQLENPALTARLLSIPENLLANPAQLNSVLAHECTLAYPLVDVIYDTQGYRREKTWRDLPDNQGDVPTIKDGGVYWISGGLGGLGVIVAKHILSYANTRVILSGRSLPNARQQQLLDELGKGRAEYLQVDFTSAQNVSGAFAYIKTKYAALNGIIHSAGVIRDAFILKKTPEQIAEVWTGKVGGLLALDQVSQHEPLDFFVTFSSIAGCFGSLGQADYAGANSVLDAYAQYRSGLVQQGERSGRSISIGWPLWADGGMQVDDHIKAQMQRMSGLVPLATVDGVHAFELALQSGAEQWIVLAGDIAKIRQTLPIGTATDESLVDAIPALRLHEEPSANEAMLKEKTIVYLKNYLATALKLPAHKVDENADLEKYGIDSVLVLKLGGELEKLFGRLPKTLFYEYKNIRELSDYFITQQRTKLLSLVAMPAETAIAETRQIPAPITRAPLPKMQRIAPLQARSDSTIPATALMDIAIVGMDGRYPQANNLEEYWENLQAGRDCISKIPAERWNHAELFHEDKNRSGSVYSKWGGFVSDIDKFDPLFFNISPREAEAMDPQERLFLQSAWKCLEDAGYTRHTISNASNGRRNIGVYVGVMYEEYQLYAAQEQTRGNIIGLSGNPSSIANRVSYIGNFNGPSMAIDTMCSSSLTAIHLACQSLREGQCTAAIAGGVNLTVHPNKYIFLSQGKFISTSGRCESFGIGGDGYVPGEGVGCLLLKPLAAAERDGDTIYGVIKGSALNHGGKTNGYTVPNPVAQSEVIRQAFADARIDPRWISYIEAHGTGTSLGDPIEISGLTRAFAAAGLSPQSCALGSAKSNIGHCESAAGIAGVSKVLLQMKHGKIAPSIHSQDLNPNIDFAETPFVVQQQLGEWHRPQVDGKERNRIAGISSFGAGGANAHVIIEEYRPAVTVDQPAISGAQLLLLSARTPESLREYADNLHRFIASHAQQLDLATLAHTLKIGREPMEYRIAFSADSLQHAVGKLSGFLHDGIHHPGIYSGSAGDKSAVASFAADAEFIPVLTQWINTGKLEKLADLWVQGVDIDWQKIYHDQPPLQKISLPTYPFARERYWVELTHAAVSTATASKLHPLVFSNTSDFYTQKYSSDFSTTLSFIADHNINGNTLLPGVAYLEMARAAGELASLERVAALHNIVWSQPILFNGNQPIATAIHLTPADDAGVINFEIVSGDNATLHSEGQIIVADTSSADVIAAMDLDALRERYSNTFNSKHIYQEFFAQGMEYGPSLQRLADIRVGSEGILARAKLPDIATSSTGDYVLHPELMDAALQSLMGFALQEKMTDAGEHKKLLVPFALQHVNIFSALPADIYIHARIAAGNVIAGTTQYDIDIANTRGEICVSLQGFSVRQLSTLTSVSQQVFYGQFAWQPEQAAFSIAQEYLPLPVDTANEIFRVIVTEEHLAQAIKSSAGSHRVSVLVPVVEFSEAALRQQFLQVFTQLRELFQQQPGARKQVIICVPANSVELGFAHLSGLLKTARQEHPQLNAKLVVLDTALLANAGNVEKIVRYESQHGDGQVDVYYNAQYERSVKNWLKISPVTITKGSAAIVENGVYWISGGLGGLGLVFAKHVLTVPGTRVILSGRSAPDAGKQAILNELREQGKQVDYIPLDISVAQDVANTYQTIKEKYGALNGVIHSAGVIRDSFLLKKTEQEIADVWQAKISGVIALDEATRPEPLDFFITFSSIAGSFGSVGQADYAAANSLLDAFCQHRNNQVVQGTRSGASISIAWPLWEEGGMQVDPATVAQIAQLSGMQPLVTAEGLVAFDAALASGKENIIVLNGDKEKIATRLLTVVRAPVAVPETLRPTQHTSNAAANTNDNLREPAQAYLKTLLAKTLKLPSHRIDASQPLEKYGIDSVMVMALTNDLQTHFGELSKTLLFEYKSIAELADYFIADHPESLQQVLGIQEKPVQAVVVQAEKKSIATSRATLAIKPGKRFAASNTRVPAQQPQQAALDVAIIGVSGRYPQAENLDVFWNNLKEGRDSISEIPAERWDLTHYYGEGSITSKWGGFIPDVDKFDPLFFNISPREAEIIDPQERLFLQHAWECIENAGYTRASIIAEGKTERDVGVFVGVMYEEYQLFGAQEQQKGNLVGLTANPSGIANRVSYFCDFHGPSMAVDTMCSSSLTAIHLACQSLRDQQCSLALAGGVNVSIHPNKYLLLSQGKFISSRGRCESFGKGGDGYVPGEGVGCLLLKPLAAAEADGDYIYGVIKGTAINHGGKTNGYTVPNPVAQARVISKALDVAQLPATAISYIEAHGTGTSLGDPIEITGLNKVFIAAGVQPGSCAIGSAKSNIGHCESAAGVAGVTKVLLQMQHGLLVPSIHSAELNPNIDFARSPFKVQQELAEWKRNTVNGVELARVAGISSFGAGGSNAHIIIEEYRGREKIIAEPAVTPHSQLIILSARSAEQLTIYAKRYLDFLDQQVTPLSLNDIAYSSQTGREEFKYRLALVSHSLAELRTQLQQVVAGTVELAEGVFSGKVADETNKLSLLTRDEDLKLGVERWIEKGKLNELAELWIAGLAIDWSLLHKINSSARRIPVPTYPFLKTRYWFTPKDAPMVATSASTPVVSLPGKWIKDTEQSAAPSHQLLAHAGKHIVLLTDSPAIKKSFAQFVAALNGILKNLGAVSVLQTTLVLVDSVDNIAVQSQDSVDAVFIMFQRNNNNVQAYQEQQALVWDNATASYPEAALYSYVDTSTAQGNMPLDTLFHHATVSSRNDQVGRYHIIGLDYSTSINYTLKVAFNAFLAERNQQPVQLSLYLGDVRWIKSFTVQPPAITDAGAPEKQIHLIEKHWRKSAARQGNTLLSHGKVLFICNAENHSFIEAYRHEFPTQDYTGLVVGTVAQQDDVFASYAYINVAAADTVAKKIQQLLQGHGVIHTVIDISRLETANRATDDNSLGMFALYQYLAKQYTDMQVLHFTRNLQALNNDEWNLTGAKTAGLIKMLSAEYVHIKARTIDVDRAAAVNASLLDIIAKELAAVLEETEIVYRQGARFIPFLQRDLASKKTLQPVGYDEQGVYLISGGTSGIGLQIAFHLADKGVKKLVLMGVSELPDESQWETLVQTAAVAAPIKEKLSAFIALKNRGVELRLYSGSLSDATRLTEFINNLKNRWGKIRGLVHSAGAMSASRESEFAFVRKNLAQVATVFAPKIEGTELLHALVAGSDLDFFVVFSSTSGYIPNFMRGLSDYGTANAFMDYFVNYQASRAATRYRSIAWVGWNDTGSHTQDKKLQQISIDGAKQFGFLFNNSATGCDMFDIALASESNNAVVLPCLLNADVFDSRASELLRCEVQQVVAKTVQEDNTFTRLLKRLGEGNGNPGPEVLGDIDLDALEEWQIEKLSSVFLEKPTTGHSQHSITPIVKPVENSSVANTAIIPGKKSGHISLDLIQELLLEQMSIILKIDKGAIEKSESFQSYGLDSISGTQLTSKLEQTLEFEMSSAWLLEYANVNELSQRILKKLTGPEELA